jgi:DUF3068 family protein
VRHRATGTVLFGLGVFFIVLALGLPLYAAGAVTKLPYDLKNTTSVARADGATFLQITETGPHIVDGTLIATTYVVPQAKTTDTLPASLKGKAVVWDVYQDARRQDNNQVVSASSQELALDRVSGAAADWDGSWEGDGSSQVKTKFEGQQYKFPFNTAKKDYQVWDDSLHKTVPAHFKGMTQVNGVDVYKFEAVIDKTQLDVSKDDIALLLGFLVPDAKDGKVFYNNVKTYLVEPVTGQFLGVREQQHKELVTDTGVTKVLLNADFNYDTKTTDNSVKTAKSNRLQILVVDQYAPIGLGVLGIALFVSGLLIVRRSGEDDGAGRHTADDSGGGAHAASGTGQHARSDGPLTDVIPPAGS